MEEMKIDLKKLVKRAGDTGDFISVDASRCDGCGRCADVCSMGLWAVSGGTARLSDRYRQLCLECAACWEICERDAVDFRYPKGGTGVVIEYG
jgi:ferredoxin